MPMTVESRGRSTIEIPTAIAPESTSARRAFEERSTLETYQCRQHSDDDDDDEGPFQWITAIFARIFESICSCFSSHGPGPISSSAAASSNASALETKIAEGDRLIDLSLIQTLSSVTRPERSVALFVLKINDEYVGKFRKVEEAGSGTIAQFAKEEWRRLLASSPTANLAGGTLTIGSLVFEKTPTNLYNCYMAGNSTDLRTHTDTATGSSEELDITAVGVNDMLTNLSATMLPNPTESALLINGILSLLVRHI